jgi:hypothetical protein
MTTDMMAAGNKEPSILTTQGELEAIPRTMSSVRACRARARCIGASMARLSMPIRTIANWSKECAPASTER